METFYPAIRTAHIVAAIASGSLLVLRAFSVNLFGARWPLTRPVRTASFLVDTVLLVAGILLLLITRQYPIADSWLTMKVLVMLPVYIVLGYFALRAGTPAGRLVAALAAIAAFLFIYSIARTHSPLGIFAPG